jgi:hypothetical protein
MRLDEVRLTLREFAQMEGMELGKGLYILTMVRRRLVMSMIQPQPTPMLGMMGT